MTFSFPPLNLTRGRGEHCWKGPPPDDAPNAPASQAARSGNTSPSSRDVAGSKDTRLERGGGHAKMPSALPGGQFLEELQPKCFAKLRTCFIEERIDQPECFCFGIQHFGVGFRRWDCFCPRYVTFGGRFGSKP